MAALSFMGDLQADAGRQAVLSFVLDAKAKVKKGGKGGAGGNLKGLWGYVWSLHDTEPDDITIVSRKDEDESSEFSVYWENHLGPMAVFFPINGAHFEVPTDDEREFMEKEQLLSPRQALDAFAAAELPMMVNPLSVFKLEGFADAPDDETSNRVLSGSRALSVAHYLRAILGDEWTGGIPLEVATLKKSGAPVTPAARIAVVGKGEVSNPANDYNQADRRVDVSVHIEPARDKHGKEKAIETMKPDEFDLFVPLTRRPK